MKTLVLIRHAKSSWELDFTDVHRPLSNRGYNDANLLSKEFLKYDFVPNAIFSSVANRALTTCNIFVENLDWDKKMLSVTEALYDFSGRQVTDFIHKLNDSLDRVVIFGHNHAFTFVANKFGDLYIDNVPTCGLVMIQFDETQWKNIDKGHTALTLFPKNFR